MGIDSFKSDDDRVYEPLENVDLFVNSPTMIPFTYDPYPHPKFPAPPPHLHLSLRPQADLFYV